MSDLAALVDQIRAGALDEHVAHDGGSRLPVQFLLQRHEQTRSTRATRALAAAEILRVERRPHTRIVIVRCPFAHLHTSRRRGHELHVHGWPFGDDHPGTRVPHCDVDPGELYRLAVTTSTVDNTG